MQLNRYIASKIRECMDTHRDNQASIGKKVKVSQVAIHKILAGGGVSLETLVRISEVYGKDINWFIGTETENTEALKKRISILEQTIAEYERLLNLKKIKS